MQVIDETMKVKAGYQYYIYYIVSDFVVKI